MSSGGGWGGRSASGTATECKAGAAYTLGPVVRRSTVPACPSGRGGTPGDGRSAPGGRAADGAQRAPRYNPALEMTIDSLMPGYLPEDGPIRVTGSVTNADDVPWAAINIYAFIGDAPMVTQASSRQRPRPTRCSRSASGSPTPRPPTRSRARSPARPRAFSLTVPRSLLPTAGPGVYWFGVHALGESIEQPREDGVADGRARTFLPYVRPAPRVTVKTALVLPIRHYLPFAADGSLEALDHWKRTLEHRRAAARPGRLRRLGRQHAGHLAGRPAAARRHPSARRSATRPARWRHRPSHRRTPSPRRPRATRRREHGPQPSGPEPELDRRRAGGGRRRAWRGSAGSTQRCRATRSSRSPTATSTSPRPRSTTRPLRHGPRAHRQHASPTGASTPPGRRLATGYLDEAGVRARSTTTPP